MEFLERGMKMLILCSYPPRECGIATFSQDTIQSIKKVFGDSLPVEVCALNNEGQHYKYGEEVTYQLKSHELENYRELGEQINQRNDIGLVCIQHEFGLYGGENGDYLLNLLLTLNKPFITVFHTVLPICNEKQRKLVRSITDLSKKIIVLTQKSKKILVNYYGINQEKTQVIPHGTHMILWQQKERLKVKHHFENRFVLSTFGLLSRNKNIETVLRSLPKLAKKYPQLIYLVIGKTHPEVFKHEAESYRNELQNLTQELEIENHVLFINEFLALDELLAYLTLSDIYLFSSKDPNQTVSGTFAYALSCGCSVIATPIPHAIEVLDGAGILLKSFENPFEFEEAITNLIENESERIKMGKQAYYLSNATVWENCAIQYGYIFGKLTNCDDHLRFNLPPIKLDHIEEMTTDKGMLQFSNFSEPDPNSGYTLDDNARALINLIIYLKNKPSKKAEKFINIYFNFIEGMQRENGLFDNYKDFDGNLTDQNQTVNLEDSNGRAIWALGYMIANQHLFDDDLNSRAEICWSKALVNIDKTSSPRAVAYTIKGLYQYFTIYPTHAITTHIRNLANQLLKHYHINAEVDWYWYEDYMTYANNVLPEAMMYSYLATNDERLKEIAIISFDFLLSHYFMKGEIKVISNNGWFNKKNERAFYGEQPIEVVTTIVALDLFYGVTGDVKYKNQIDVAFSWFLGNNHLKQIMYNPVNGASYDGLEDTQININQGAESTLCFLKAQMIMEKYQSEVLVLG